MLMEALETWERHATDWLEKIVERCATLGVETSVALLHQQVQQALQPLAKDASLETRDVEPSDFEAHLRRSAGFDKELLQLDGWTPDPGPIILPVDGSTHLLTRQILRLDLRNVVLLRGRKVVRCVPWEKVTLAHLAEGEVILEIADEPPLMIAGYRDPAQVLAIIQQCYETATERILQAVAAKVIRPTP